LNYLIFVWIGILVAAIVAEVMTESLIAIWFIPASIINSLLSVWSDIFWIQLLIFIVVSGALLTLSFTVWKKHRHPAVIPTNVPDMIIGKSARVVEEIDNRLEVGAVKIDGKVWSARAKEFGTTFPIDTEVVITEISGVKLIVE